MYVAVFYEKFYLILAKDKNLGKNRHTYANRNTDNDEKEILAIPVETPNIKIHTQF